MQVSARSTKAIEAPTTRTPLVGKAFLTRPPTLEQTRMLVFILARHQATAPKFHEVSVPLKLLFPDLPPKARAEAVWTLFDKNSPGLDIQATDAAGRLIPKGSFCMMPLLSYLSYREGSRTLRVKLNSAILDYLPQLLELVAQSLLAFAPAPGPAVTLQLAA